MKYTTGKYFLDTNFLLYCFSIDEVNKREMCRAILQEGRGKVNFVISSQVIKEFSSVMLTKFKVEPLKVKQIIDDFKGFEIVQVDLPIIQKGIELYSIYKISFWNGLIVADADAAACEYLLSEDMQHEQKISSLTIYNPFLKIK